jgi:uncharacterized protein with GYD domain
LKVGTRGVVRTTTLRAYDHEEMLGINRRLGWGYNHPGRGY